MGCFTRRRSTVRVRARPPPKFFLLKTIQFSIAARIGVEAVARLIYNSQTALLKVAIRPSGGTDCSRA